MIYQMADTAMNPKQTVGEIIGRPLDFYHNVSGAEKDRRVVELLKMIELDESFIDRLPSELSGGQKQRICIARALAAEPEVIIWRRSYICAGSNCSRGNSEPSFETAKRTGYYLSVYHA